MSDLNSQFPFTFPLAFSGLKAGTTTTVTTTAAFDYFINSIAYQASAITNGATPTTDAVTGDAFTGVLRNKGCYFAVGLDSSGSVLAVQGSIEDLDTSGAFITASKPGPVPDGFCQIGYVIITAGSTANNTTGWIFGTSNWSGVTGVTATFGSSGGLSARPQTS